MFSTALWSVAMLDRDHQWRIVAGIGVLSACAQAALQLGPAAHLTPQTLIMVPAAKGPWFVGLIWLVGFRGAAEEA
jgi:hypothetical protein